MFNDFDIDAPVFNDRFLEVQDELVAKCPVAHSTVGEGYHVINRYEDVKKAERAVASAAHLVLISELPRGDPAGEENNKCLFG